MLACPFINSADNYWVAITLPVTVISAGQRGEQDEILGLEGLMIQCDRDAPKQIKPWGKKKQHRRICHENMEEEATICATEIRKNYREERTSDLCFQECLWDGNGVRGAVSPQKQPI